MRRGSVSRFETTPFAQCLGGVFDVDARLVGKALLIQGFFHIGAI